MTCALLVIHDGRDDYLQRTLASAEEMLPAFDQYITVDDTAHELGFAGAIAKGWEQVDTDYLFHLEGDFTFNRPVPVDDMIEVLGAHPHLVQMALLRQPWNHQEKAAGGIVPCHPDSFVQRGWGDHVWLEHTRCFTTNPAVIPRWVIDRGWPQRSQSEGHFGLRLFASDHTLRSAYWGTGDEWVQHIGAERRGRGY